MGLKGLRNVGQKAQALRLWPGYTALMKSMRPLLDLIVPLLLFYLSAVRAHGMELTDATAQVQETVTAYQRQRDQQEEKGLLLQLKRLQEEITALRAIAVEMDKLDETFKKRQSDLEEGKGAERARTAFAQILAYSTQEAKDLRAQTDVYRRKGDGLAKAANAQELAREAQSLRLSELGKLDSLITLSSIHENFVAGVFSYWKSMPAYVARADFSDVQSLLGMNLTLRYPGEEMDYECVLNLFVTDRDDPAIEKPVSSLGIPYRTCTPPDLPLDMSVRRGCSGPIFMPNPPK